MLVPGFTNLTDLTKAYAAEDALIALNKVDDRIIASRIVDPDWDDEAIEIREYLNSYEEH